MIQCKLLFLTYASIYILASLRGQLSKSFVCDIICFSVQCRVLTESSLSHGPKRVLIVLAVWTPSFQELPCLFPLMRLQSPSSLKWPGFASKKIRVVSDCTITSPFASYAWLNFQLCESIQYCDEGPEMTWCEWSWLFQGRSSHLWMDNKRSLLITLKHRSLWFQKQR